MSKPPSLGTKPKRPPGMSKNPRKPAATELRDPTVHELHNGPERSQLPETVRNNARSETVCKFCGVSYLVFSEIKELEKRLQNTEEQLIEHRRKAQQFDLLQQKVHELVALQKQHQQEHSALQTRSANLEASIYEREEALSRATKETQLIKSKVTGVRAALQRERINVDNLKMKTVRTLSDMSNLMKSTQHEIGVVGTRLRREEELRHNAEEELRQLQEVVQKERAAHATHEEHMRAIQQDLQTLTANNEALQHANQVLHTQQHETQQQHTHTVQELQLQHDTDRTLYETQMQALQLKCTAVEQQHSAEQTLSEERRTAIVALEQQLKVMHNQSSASTTALQKSLDDLRRQHERLKMIHEMDKKQLREEASQLNATLQRQTDQLKQQQTDLQQATIHTTTVEKNNVELTHQLQQAREQLQQLQLSLGDTTNAQQRNLIQVQNQHREESQTLQDTVAQLQKQLSQERGAHTKTTEHMQTKQLDLQRAMDSTSMEMQTWQSKCTAFTQANRLLQQEKHALTRQVLEGTVKYDQTMEALVEAKLALERAERKEEISKQEVVQVKQVVLASEQTIAELRHALAMKNEENMQLKSEADKHRGKAEAAGSDSKEEMFDGIEMLEKHLIKLSEKLRTKNNEVEQLQAVIHRECIQRGSLMDELVRLRER